MITTVAEIKGDKVNWVDLGIRFRKFRKDNNLSAIEIAETVGVSDKTISALELGFKAQPKGGTRKSVNILWALSQKWDLSINWLLNGEGEPHDPDPVSLLPETLIVQKGAGIRRDQQRLKAEEGRFADETLEFVLGIDKFKRINDMPFPTLTQIYDIVLALGYRKVKPARIAPLGYVIEVQRLSEKLKPIQEKEEAHVDENRIFLAPKPKPKLISNPQQKKRRTFVKRPGFSRTEKGKHFKSHVDRSGPKKYLITDPQGKQYLTDSLISFCGERGLYAGRMGAIARGNAACGTYRGWRSKEFLLELKSDESTRI